VVQEWIVQELLGWRFKERSTVVDEIVFVPKDKGEDQGVLSFE
jgi:hypothetical protein